MNCVRLKNANKYLAQVGVPIQIISSKNKESSFKNIVNHQLNIMISSQEQESVYNQLVNHEVALGEPCLIVVGTESALSGQKLAYNICERYYDDRIEPFPFIKWLNLAFWDFDFIRDHIPTNGIVVIGAIDKNFDAKKLSLARDYINTVKGSTVIVIIETADVVLYMSQFFNLSPDIIFQIGRQTVQRARM